ncbi:uncharacterized protein TNCV_133521 [Trichonephila clavipes]|nr:uncharacterized protein TNCV_133521 [Trichonephila clavipes]
MTRTTPEESHPTPKLLSHVNSTCQAGVVRSYSILNATGVHRLSTPISGLSPFLDTRRAPLSLPDSFSSLFPSPTLSLSFRLLFRLFSSSPEKEPF